MIMHYIDPDQEKSRFIIHKFQPQINIRPFFCKPQCTYIKTFIQAVLDILNLN